jgi:polygalacturonase
MLIINTITIKIHSIMKIIVFIHMLILITGSLNCYSKDFLIEDYGAASGKLSTLGIQKAVDDCYACGGGRVLIPSGTFITGPVFLRSNTDIYLESGAVLKGSENVDDYNVNGDIHGIFYCEDETNISISSHGIIDASGSHFYDPKISCDGFDRSVIRQKETICLKVFSRWTNQKNIDAI